jgi:hypothetical protein
MVKDINIEFPSTEHGIAYGHIDVSIIPRVKRIKERTCAEQCGNGYSEDKQEKRFPKVRLLHNNIIDNIRRQKYIIILIQPLLLLKKSTSVEVF